MVATVCQQISDICQVVQFPNDSFSGAVGDPCHVEAGVDFALGVRRARLQDLGFRRLRLQEADESGKAATTFSIVSVFAYYIV